MKQKPLPRTARPTVAGMAVASISESSIAARVVISKTMVSTEFSAVERFEFSWQPASEVIQHLAEHDCPDITNQLDLTQCSTSPITGGGYGDIYSGTLKDGLNVAIKCVRLFFGSDAANSKPLKVSRIVNFLTVSHEKF